MVPPGAFGLALAEDPALEEGDHRVVVLPRAGGETGGPAGPVEVLGCAPAVLHGDRGVEPAALGSALHGDAVAAEFDVGERVVGQDDVTDDTDRDRDRGEFGGVDTRSTGVLAGGVDGRVDQGLAEMVVPVVTAGTAAQPAPTVGVLQSDERPGPKVEGVAHTPELFPCAVLHERLDGVPGQFHGSDPVRLREFARCL